MPLLGLVSVNRIGAARLPTTSERRLAGGSDLNFRVLYLQQSKGMSVEKGEKLEVDVGLKWRR